MGACHLVSKRLLRHGIIYTDGAARTGAHRAWLACRHIDIEAIQVAFEAVHEAVLLPSPPGSTRKSGYLGSSTPLQEALRVPQSSSTDRTYLTNLSGQYS